MKGKLAGLNKKKSANLKSKQPKKTLDLSRALVRLKKHYPEVRCELNAKNPFELLVATVLSAQCTDERVNQVTPALFLRAPTPQKMSECSREEIETLIRPTGFFHNKAKNLLELSKKICQEHQGEVPRTSKDLESLPGVGRKTANVVLGNAFGMASGVVVDTHVSRLTQRFGWVPRGSSPDRIADILERTLPQEEWIDFSHRLIQHGRQICKARNPQCGKCFLVDPCPKTGVE